MSHSCLKLVHSSAFGITALAHTDAAPIWKLLKQLCINGGLKCVLGNSREKNDGPGDWKS